MKRIQLLLIVAGTFCVTSEASSASTPGVDPERDDQSLSTDRNDSPYLQVAGILPKDGEDMYELEFWNSIKESTHAEDYEAYLKSYPNGRFAPLAKIRAARYRGETPPPEPSAEESIAVDEMQERYDVVTNTNVRKGPSSNTDKIGELKQGVSVDVTGKVADKNWYRIRLPGGGMGYVYAPLLTKSAPQAPQTPQPPLPQSPPPLPTAADAAKPEAGVGRDCPSCPEMVSLSPGTFTMGDDRGDRSERPAHTVTLSKPFAIGKYEVTVGQWKACVAAGACKQATPEIMTTDDAPVRDVSWKDATDYAKWLSKTTGQAYRLPTEAEWEYAARAGSNHTYWWGDSMVPGKAYCKDCGGKWDQELPAEVGSYEANPFGLYDMNGNVWEWVSDCWHRNYNGAPSDGRSWNEEGCTVRVIRSGSWRNDKTYVHSASRFKYDAFVRYLQNGFRVAKSLE